MKKHIAALAVPALLVTSNAMAIELYNDSTNSFSVGGRLNIAFENKKTDERNTTAEDMASRINFVFGRDMGNDWSATSVLEYGMATPQSDNFNSFYNRLGYVQIGHEDYGRFSFGKQWGTYFDVAGVTDVLWVYGSTANGTRENGGVAGTGRANDALIYRNNFGNVNVSAQYQVTDQSNGRDRGYAAAIGYNLGDFTLGTVYNVMERTDAEKADIGAGDAQMWNTSVRYMTSNIYSAVSYGIYKDHISIGSLYGNGEQTLVAEKAHGLEALYMYTLDSGIQLYTAMNSLNDDNSDARWQYYSLGTMYNWNEVLFYGELKFEDSKDEFGIDRNDNMGAIGVRYHF
ncbi:hypothetical protein L4C54_16375 [Vibrio lamellibrachiae]|uniref:porin n=1 Tax=Vibrio lamellibrachiae TaxID=2910253 RepID=UPI003D0E2139